MSAQTDQTKDFLAQNDAAIDRLREVALREFGRGPEGLQAIIKELSGIQAIARSKDLSVLVDCLGDISSVLRTWAEDAAAVAVLGDVSDPWADVMYELSNYFVFMADDDQHDLRQRVNYRLTVLAKAFAAKLPATPVQTESDGSWGLFDENAAAAQKAAPPPVAPAPTAAAMAVAPTPPSTPASVPTPAVDQDNKLASHYLICLLGTQQYALPIHQVREILEQRLEKPLPLQRKGIVGLVSVRGLVCPVVDVSHVLHAKEETDGEIHKKRCMVVCEVDRRTFCFNVDDVKQVAAVDEFQDQIKPLAGDSQVQRAISHVAHFQDKSVLFVKMREVIPA